MTSPRAGGSEGAVTLMIGASRKTRAVPQDVELIPITASTAAGIVSELRVSKSQSLQMNPFPQYTCAVFCDRQLS